MLAMLSIFKYTCGMSENKNMSITAAAIEAAAKAIYEVYPSLAIPGDESSAVPWESAHQIRKHEDRKQARAALEAGAPHIRAQALNEAADGFEKASGMVRDSTHVESGIYHDLVQQSRGLESAAETLRAQAATMRSSL